MGLGAGLDCDLDVQPVAGADAPGASLDVGVGQLLEVWVEVLRPAEAKTWWLRVDLNHRPRHYECRALTN